ncbi:MAG TPA: anhydro-N-acetylmuramic acid kinase [Candidatus Hydrogenedentes bacterium]|nr:anhydro-N-acetylmuramic acid kinase [Candidatus Hydrogenedentota bacterium]HOL77633.1 anhydro-N-acetylmuramic acid kinase [Candidatus Hydrogenedentota bacterium]HPO86758.1 anhydro-N-acetylmuramic acid kinase [Candidatus Hydrogenedentota bacterium]
MDLRELRDKEYRYGIGLTVGTSCAGIDAAAVRIRGTGRETAVKPLLYEHFPYSPATRNRLLMARKDNKAMGLLHFELGELLATAAQRIAEKLAARDESAQVDFAAIKGFPASHIPPRGAEPMVRGGLEIGEPAFVATSLGVPVISDFYAKDMAVGGQGAPIFSYADHVLFGRKDRTVAVLHLGAFASLTVLPPELDQVIGFHVGPCNIALDGAIHLITAGNREMDTDGKAAFQGVVIDEFLDYLLDHPFLNRVPPKSTSREEFGPEVYLRDAIAGRRDRSLEDLQATVTAAVANSIIRAYGRFVKSTYEVSRLILTGGGVRNTTLVDYLKKGLTEMVFRRSDDYGLPSMAADPVRAAILGNEAVCGTPSNVPRATGARLPICLGKITLPK